MRENLPAGPVAIRMLIVEEEPMRFDIYTLFPSLFDSVFAESIVRRAIEAELVSIGIHNIRTMPRIATT
jgi:hypothetical protein